MALCSKCLKDVQLGASRAPSYSPALYVDLWWGIYQHSSDLKFALGGKGGQLTASNLKCDSHLHFSYALVRAFALLHAMAPGLCRGCVGTSPV